MDCWVLTDSKTMVMRLQIAERPPLGNDRESEASTVGQGTRTRVDQAGYHASMACHSKGMILYFEQKNKGARIISRKQPTTKNFQQPKCLLLRHITSVESQQEAEQHKRGPHIKIAAARIFIACGASMKMIVLAETFLRQTWQYPNSGFINEYACRTRRRAPIPSSD